MSVLSGAKRIVGSPGHYVLCRLCRRGGGSPSAPMLNQPWACAVHVLTDPENTGRHERGVNFDTLGTWNNRPRMDIDVAESIRQGAPVPKVTLDTVGCVSLTGRRKVNEDRCVFKELPCPRENTHLLYFGVFDGHGGSAAADYASQNLEQHILYWIYRGVNDLNKVLHNSFIEVNNAFARHVAMDHNAAAGGGGGGSAVVSSGSTATVCLLRNSTELAVGHVGDSRALLCRRGRARRLTTEHAPDNGDEERRLSQSGAHVTTNSVGVQLVNGRLAMSRSIGDLDLKPYGVVATPEVNHCRVKHSADSFIALTTDGINFVMSDDDICGSINRCEHPDEAAHFLADQALQYGSDDNTSAVILPLGAWGKYSSPLTSLHGSGFVRWSASNSNTNY